MTYFKGLQEMVFSSQLDYWTSLPPLSLAHLSVEESLDRHDFIFCPSFIDVFVQFKY